ncbi:MAG: hypothetical protein HZT39_09635 [Pseudoxanthomonas sp.]|nr:MAG: hypothetical protein HZT39_09635 [Pseudoxanthomonas sp.]
MTDQLANLIESQVAAMIKDGTLLPRQRYCHYKRISERTYDRRADIPKIRVGRRIYSPKSYTPPILPRA